ncbi:MAG TPA: glycosyltransferase family 4 protein [Puia sp.]|nr:glycosyltransferase family 4 protein [Puia sp.]
MKVLFISRATLFTVRGGDTSQIVNTALYLEKLGVQADVRLCDETIDYRGYDLIHFFNVIRPADILKHIERSGKPYVITPIFVDYSEYDRTIRKGMTGFVLRWLSPDGLEYVKAIARLLVNGEKLVSPSYLWLGQRRSIRKILSRAEMILPNSNSELSRLRARYNGNAPARIIPNAIDPSVFTIDGDTAGRGTGKKESREGDLVISVGRIEGLKNQLNLVRALNGTRYRLILIGSPAPNHKAYYEECRKIAEANISFVDHIEQKELAGYYSRANVHVLPSWFETTGLSSLEAAAMGCNLVITDKGDAREYFEDYAWYCDPASPASIFEAVEKAAACEFREALREKVFAQYTWPHTAERTLGAYQEIINRSN